MNLSEVNTDVLKKELHKRKMADDHKNKCESVDKLMVHINKLRDDPKINRIDFFVRCDSTTIIISHYVQ
jgi:hypothetical protein